MTTDSSARGIPDPFEDVIGGGIARTSTRVGNSSTLQTDRTLLRMMMWEVATNAGMAQNAMNRLLGLRAQEEMIDFPVWENVQLVTTSLIAATNCIWPIRKKDKARGEDMERHLQLGKAAFEEVRKVRNAMMHLDERLVDHFSDDRENLYARQVWEAGEPQPNHILGWDCTSKQLYSFDTVVDGRSLKKEIDLLAARSLDAAFYTRWVE